MKHSLRTRYLPGTVLASIAGIALAASAPAQTAREVDEVMTQIVFSPNPLQGWAGSIG